MGVIVVWSCRYRNCRCRSSRQSISWVGFSDQVDVLTTEMTLDATPTFITASTDLEKVYANGFAPPVGSDAVFIEGG